ncbi:MAG: DivIVA domain-containing protein [Solirubrobacteraceae bacterium]
MALDRQSIERKDFPVGRRGYDPEAVDAHLAALADEVAKFKRDARRRTDTLASSASEQVRAIVEAAETSASDIQREAESEAKEIRQEADSEAQATREQATDQSREYVGKASESTAKMLERLDAMEGELGALIESLRTGANRLDADLRLLEGNLAEVSEAVTPGLRFEPEGSKGPSASDAETASPSETAIDEPTGTASDTGGEAVASAESADGGEGAGGRAENTGETGGHEAGHDKDSGVAGHDKDSGVASQAEGHDDAEGARLIALNMALNGTPRDETSKYLTENFHLSDRDGLLDEVYASVEG